jgi:F-type H+-transporting ATPase subunit gamma
LNNRLFKQVFTKYESAKHRPDTFIVGKKALEFFSRTDFPVVGQTNIKDAFEQEDLAELFTFLNKAIGDQQYKSIQIYFNYFENAIKQTPLHMQVIPLSKHTLKTFGEQINIDVNQFLTKKVETSDIILEPSLPALVEEIKSQFIQHMIYGSILRNKTGEFAARMIAMKNAKDNSTTMIKNLRLSYNKARQSAVTQEISEIMGAKMALEG